VDIVELALGAYGAPVYVRHAIVHNTHVVAELEAKGAMFVEDEAEVPPGSVLVFSAHGVTPEARRNAEARNLRTVDATCPLVTKVHLEALKYASEGYSIVLVGHAGHQEVIGTTGHAPEAITLVQSPAEVETLEFEDPAKVAYISQTTLSVDEAEAVISALKRRYPLARGPRGDDICYATQNRQDATKVLAERSELVLVVGSPHSSNSNRMVEVARAHGAARAELIDDASGIREEWLEGLGTVGLTSGASAPEVLVQGVIDALQARPGGAKVEVVDVVAEQMHFALPSELRRLPLANST